MMGQQTDTYSFAYRVVVGPNEGWRLELLKDDFLYAHRDYPAGQYGSADERGSRWVMDQVMKDCMDFFDDDED